MPAAPLFAEVGVRDLASGDPDARLPLACLDALWDRAAARLGDIDLGLHLAASVEPDSFGLLSYLGTASATWGDGLARVLRYFRLLSDGSRYELTVDGEIAAITATQDTASGAPVRQRVEFTVAVLACYAHHLVGEDWQVTEVFLEHAAPPVIAEHIRILGRAPRFEAPQSGFAFPAVLLGRPLRTRNATLVALLEGLASRLLGDLPGPTTVAGALRALCIREGFHPELTLDAAAHRLRLSPRTLQRRLREEGTSHHEVVDATRRHVASRMLARSDVGIADVAFALGFSEPGALHRAFKRWTGMTPTEYRRNARPA